MLGLPPLHWMGIGHVLEVDIFFSTKESSMGIARHVYLDIVLRQKNLAVLM